MARLGARSFGVVTHQELLRAGITVAEIKWRLRTGALIAQYRGVYRVGHTAPSSEADYMAAVKACGPGAILSGFAAAYLYRLVKGRPPLPEVTTPSERRVNGVRTHRARAGIDPRDACRWRGLPITTVPRTLLDLTAVLTVDALARAYHEAQVRHGTRPEHVDTVLARHATAKRRRNLIRVIHGDEPVVLSELERGFLALLRKHGLPLPETNRPAGGHWVDCRWPEHKLTVELDSFRYHNSRYAWERDRERERQARRRGDRFRRYTWTDVFEQPEQMLEDLRRLLS